LFSVNRGLSPVDGVTLHWAAAAATAAAAAAAAVAAAAAEAAEAAAVVEVGAQLVCQANK
jgi:hypothetical protein